MPRLLLAILAPLAMFGILELGLRVLQNLHVLPRYEGSSLSVGDDTMYEHNAKLVRSSDPILQFEFQPGDPLLNSKGTRGPEFEAAKPPGTFRIAAIGDSVTFGLGVATEDTFCAQLGRLLNARDDGRRYEVLNFGVNGYGTVEELQLFRKKVHAFGPDLVLVTYVLNDITPPSVLHEVVGDRMRTIARIDRIAPYSQVAAWALVTRDRVASSRDPYAAYERMYLDPEFWSREVEAMRGFTEVSRETPVAVVIVPLLTDYSRHGLRRLHERVHGLLGELGLAYLDLADSFQERSPEELRLKNDDDTHPNAAGHSLIAQEVSRWLPEVMKGSDTEATD